MPRPVDVWLAAGVRTPFAKVDGPLAASRRDRALAAGRAPHARPSSHGATPDFMVWGTVVPNLTWSNIAREVLMDAGAPADASPPSRPSWRARPA